MNHPSVSVCMPVYNAERHVSEAVESILVQTLGDFEFLIIDDGSTDRSRAILEAYAKQDDRVRLISRPNTGIVGALNEMLAMARGELVARMDADDVALPTRIEQQVAYLNDHPDCVMVGSRVLIIDSEGDEVTVMGDALSHEQIIADLLAGKGQMVYHPAVMYRRQVVIDLGGYRVDLEEAEDLDLFLRLAEVGRIVNLPEPLLKYREHLHKAGHARAERLGRYTGMILNEARRRRGMGPLPEDSHVSTRTPTLIYQTWGWWALGSGRISTARKYGWASLARAPFSPSSWRLLYCALRGH